MQPSRRSPSCEHTLRNSMVAMDRSRIDVAKRAAVGHFRRKASSSITIWRAIKIVLFAAIPIVPTSQMCLIPKMRLMPITTKCMPLNASCVKSVTGVSRTSRATRIIVADTTGQVCVVSISATFVKRTIRRRRRWHFTRRWCIRLDVTMPKKTSANTARRILLPKDLLQDT